MSKQFAHVFAITLIAAQAIANRLSKSEPGIEFLPKCYDEFKGPVEGVDIVIVDAADSYPNIVAECEAAGNEVRVEEAPAPAPRRSKRSKKEGDGGESQE